MPLVPAKCTQCGSNVEVDDSKEAAICSHCGTPFIVEKAITNYNVNIGTVNVQGANADNYAHLGDEAMTTKEYDKALDYYTKVVELIGDTRYDIHMLRLVLFLKTGKMNCEQVFSYLPEYLERLQTDTQTSEEVKILRENTVFSYLFDDLDSHKIRALAKYHDVFPSKFQESFRNRCDTDFSHYKSRYIATGTQANLDNLKRIIEAKNIVNPDSPHIVIDDLLKTIKKEQRDTIVTISWILFIGCIAVVVFSLLLKSCSH